MHGGRMSEDQQLGNGLLFRSCSCPCSSNTIDTEVTQSSQLQVKMAASVSSFSMGRWKATAYLSLSHRDLFGKRQAPLTASS